jgi:hypothetical protein
MAKNTIGAPPFPPVVVIDKNEPITQADVDLMLAERPHGVSICLRYAHGGTTRGGYFFHFQPSANETGQLSLYDFEKLHVVNLSPTALVAFINHCTGRQFDVLCESQPLEQVTHSWMS